MDELSLLHGDDPQKLLSAAARKQITLARFESQHIRVKALADANFEFKGAGSPGGDFTDYLFSKSPTYRAVVLESIRIVLRVYFQVFAAIGIPGPQLREILYEEIEGAMNSYRNHDEPVGDIDKRAFESEAFTWVYERELKLKQADKESDEDDDAAALQRAPSPKSPRAVILNWMKENEVKTHALAARELGVSATVLSGIKRGSALAENRCSSGTLADVAKKIGCLPADLTTPPLK